MKAITVLMILGLVSSAYAEKPKPGKHAIAEKGRATTSLFDRDVFDFYQRIGDGSISDAKKILDKMKSGTEAEKKLAEKIARIDEEHLMMELTVYRDLEDYFAKEIGDMDKTEKEPKKVAKKILVDLVTNGTSDELPKLNKKLDRDQRRHNLTRAAELSGGERGTPLELHSLDPKEEAKLNAIRFRQRIENMMKKDIAQKFHSALSFSPLPELKLASPE